MWIGNGTGFFNRGSTGVKGKLSWFFYWKGVFIIDTPFNGLL